MITGLQTLKGYILILNASIVSIHGYPGPDPASKNNAVLDPDPQPCPSAGITYDKIHFSMPISPRDNNITDSPDQFENHILKCFTKLGTY
jgi:hypothetical protein